MTKTKYPIMVFILGFILIIAIIGVAFASDDDLDGIDDDYEDNNKRQINIEFSGDMFEVESLLEGDDQIDDIGISVSYNEEGVSVKIGYDPHYEGEELDLFELEFEISFRKIIEFIDNNGDYIFDNVTDTIIQEFEINYFNPITYSIIDLPTNTNIHYVIINTTDGIFTAHFYFTEEFTIVNNTLITPTQTKIDIDINNFNYMNTTSMLALSVLLEAESEYEEEEETEDEELGFATNEDSVFVSNFSRSGFFSWKKNATIDGILKDVFISPIQNDVEEDKQKMYINYPHGNYISHDPKIGIEGILKPILSSPFTFDLVIMIIIITGITIAVAYSVYHYRANLISAFISNNQKLKSKKKDTAIKQRFFNTENNDPHYNPNLTAITEDFMDIVNQFEWKDNEKDEFIKDMLALSPTERQSILKEMQKKSRE